MQIEVNKMTRKHLDAFMGGILIGSAMTLGCITLGFTVYRDTQGLKSTEVSSVPTRPQDIDGDDYQPRTIDYLEQAPPEA